VETGGLSGAPLRELSLNALRTLRAYLPESVPLIGCGGISTGADALEFARAGASLVQVYTAFGYAGAGAPRRIKDEVCAALRAEGRTWNEIVRSASQELSLKETTVEKTENGEEGVQTLIRQAEELKGLLDGLAERSDHAEKDELGAGNGVAAVLPVIA